MGLEYRLNDNKSGLVVIGGKNLESKLTIPKEDSFRGKIYPVIAIGTGAFLCCSGLTSVVIPDSVIAIGGGAFIECTGLTSMVIPTSVTEIGNRAFMRCSGLTSIVIPNSVITIGGGAFIECTGLTSVVIPASVTKVGIRAFEGCTGLTSVNVDKENRHYDSREGSNAIIESDTNTLVAGCSTTVIPSSVTKIGDDAFFRCTGLTSIVIPDSVTAIGRSAFFCCTGLTSIVINDASLLEGTDVPEGVEIVKP